MSLNQGRGFTSNVLQGTPIAVAGFANIPYTVILDPLSQSNGTLFTAKVAGYYLASMDIVTDSGNFSILKNNVIAINHAPLILVLTGNASVSLSGIIFLNGTTDFISFQFNGGTAMDSSGSIFITRVG